MTIQLVGRYRTGYLPLSTSGATVSLTSLTGGLASQPASGDLIIVVIATAGTQNHTLTIKDSSGGSDYTLIGAELYANDTRDTNLRVAYKFAGGSPDTSCFVNVSTASNTCHIAVEVWRGVEPSNPLDVAATTATGANTGQPDPAAITPVTAGAMILVAGAGTTPYNAPADFTSSSFDGFTSGYQAGDVTRTSSAILGIGYKAWTSGAFDAAAFGGGANNSNESWASVTFALRPLPVPIEGALSKTLGEATLSGTGSVLTGGSLAVALDDTGLSAAGVVWARAETAIELDGLALIASGTAPSSGLAVTFENTTLTSAASVPIRGGVTSAMEGSTLSAQAISQVSGTLDTMLDGMGLSSAAQVVVQGVLSTTTADATLVAAAAIPISGTLNTTLAGTTLVARAGSFITVVTPPSRRLDLAQSHLFHRRLALAPALLASRRLPLSTSRLAQRRLEL